MSNEIEQKIDEILNRGVLIDFLPTKKEFRDKLLSGQKMRFYIGADPTAKALHLGHAQNLMVLEDFRKLGHEVIFLIGDFTGMIGDPTDKSSARVKQTREGVEENFKGWLEQIKSILSFDDAKNPVQVRYNSEWLGKLNFAEVLELASNFTVQQMLERDMFKRRMHGVKGANTAVKCRHCECVFPSPIQFGDNESFNSATLQGNLTNCPKCGKITGIDKEDLMQSAPIYLHEFLYPLMQGYDSVAMDVDVELCGTDQIFNALAGRTLMRKLKNKEKFVVATKMIADEKTGMLMSKSNGTGVFLGLDANNLFGAIMSQPDGMLKPLFIGCTRISLDEIEKLLQLENPRDAKIALATEIVKIYHGEAEAEKAKEYFIKTISNKEIPDDVRVVPSKAPEISILDYMVEADLATSKSDARRKIEQGGVSVDGEKITTIDLMLDSEYDSRVIKVGKFGFAKIKFE